MTGGNTQARWLISGVVQGVGFRWFALKHAERLGICGWSRNLPDGRVEVVAEGSGEALTLLEEQLRKGPRFSRVEDVEKTEFPHEVSSFKPFFIK